MCKCPVTAATNKQHSAAKDTAKLDRETEQLRRKSPNLPNALFITLLPPDDTVTLSLSRALQQARVAKTWSQKDLATVSSLPYPPFLLSLSISPSLPLLSFYFSLPSSSTIAIQYLKPSSPVLCVHNVHSLCFESTPSLPSFLPGGTRGSTRNRRWLMSTSQGRRFPTSKSLLNWRGHWG